MNDTASAGGASGASLIPSTTDAFTAAHLAIIAIFALLTIVAIIWGIRLKRQRRTAERDIAEHNAEVARTADDTPAPTPVEATALVPTSPVTPPAPQATDPATDVPAATDPIADEPIAASAPLDAAPAQEAASAPAAPAPVSADPAGAPVSTLKGLGPSSPRGWANSASAPWVRSPRSAPNRLRHSIRSWGHSPAGWSATAGSNRPASSLQATRPASNASSAGCNRPSY